MPVNCVDLIQQGYQKDCAREPKKGLGREAILINYEDVDWANVVVGADANIITTLPLKSGGKQGYSVVNFKDPFNGTVKAFHEGTYINSWDKTFVFATITRDQKQSLQLNDPLANAKFIAIVRNEDAGSDGKCTFEIYGYHNGLKLTAADHNPYGDTYGGDLFTAQEQEAGRSAMYLFNTDVSTTEAAVQSYLTPTVTPEPASSQGEE
jgi:hypothetical protein